MFNLSVLPFPHGSTVFYADRAMRRLGSLKNSANLARGLNATGFQWQVYRCHRQGIASQRTGFYLDDFGASKKGLRDQRVDS